MFNALMVRKDDEGKTSAQVEEISEDDLPEGDVLVAVEHSTVNYKDGLCIGPGGGLVRNYPHVPGIDFSGTVEASDDDRYKPGDKVVLTGWRVGEAHWGGYAQKARVKADWLVPLPDGLTTRQAMAVGTAGFTAMLAVQALEDHGIKDGPVLVTGAAGGVGRCDGAGGPMGVLAASQSSRSCTCRLMVRASVWARTMPATELSSAIAMARIPSSAARAMYSSGWDAPVRKVKFEVIDSSVNMAMRLIVGSRTVCSTFVPAESSH